MNDVHTALQAPALPALKLLREAMQLFWSVADQYVKRRLALSLILVAIGAALSALGPVALKLIVDSLASGDPLSGYSATIALVLLYVGAQYAARGATEFRTMLHGHATQRLKRHIGRRLFDHLVHLPMRFHTERKTGAIGQVCEQGLQGYELVLNHAIYTILPVAVELAIVAIVLLRLGHQVLLAVLALACLAYVASFRRAATVIRSSAQDASRSVVQANALLTDSLLNHEVVKYFNAERFVSSRYDEALSTSETAWRAFFTRRTTSGLVVATIFAGSLGLSLLYAVNSVSDGRMTVGDFVLVNAYILRLVQPLELLGFAIRDTAQGLAFLASMLRLLREGTEADSCAHSRTQSASSGELVFRNVSFSYRQERQVLKDVGFRAAPGETVAIVGVSGSGKSSLIRLLFRLYEPDGGEILLDDVPISHLSLSALRTAIAVVPQDTILFNDSISRNIGFGKPDATAAEIEEAARQAKLHDFIISLPEKYDTLVGERGIKLSGGERQRIAIARAVLKCPQVIVFDEATSNLDTRTERGILDNLIELSRQRTTLIIAHRLSCVVHAQRIVVLDCGTAVEQGTHAQLLASNGYYANLWRLQEASSAESA